MPSFPLTVKYVKIEKALFMRGMQEKNTKASGIQLDRRYKYHEYVHG